MWEEYRQWLAQQEYADNTINSRIANARSVQDYHGDLDTAFEQDGLQNLLALFQYTMDDQNNNRPNPTNIPINGILRTNLAMYKNAIGLYQRFRNETANDTPVRQQEDAEIIPSPQAKRLISLERDMQVMLRRDIEQLERGLSIIDDGAERKVDSGLIDITAKDANGSIVVIELKIGKADRTAIGQILGYMGDIKEEEGDTPPIRGILVADSFDQGAKSGARMISGLSLKKYAVTFSFFDGQEI